MLTNTSDNKKVRLYILWSLAFSFLAFGCSEKKKDPNLVTIYWKDNKAESIFIPKQILYGIPGDSLEYVVQVQRENVNTGILGEFTPLEGAAIFRPAIAFTRGLKYEVKIRDKVMAEFEIPLAQQKQPPLVRAVFPTRSDVPENLLKMYIAFSKPMQEGDALKHVAVIKDHKDTIPVFLDLDHELWNSDRTILTLWLDPGRIKRDLQPNLAMGAPLKSGIDYQLVIKKGWPDQEGTESETIYHKPFRVSPRDSVSPDPALWTFNQPKAGSRESLAIDFHESLDYVLLKNAIRIVDANGNIIKGISSPESRETVLNFIPDIAWVAGSYTVEFESRLEDLAGNNLNRPFDNDLAKKSNRKPQDIYKRSFTVQ